MSKPFVPVEVVEFIRAKAPSIPEKKKARDKLQQKLNRKTAEAFPSASKRTVQRWTSAVLNDEYRTKTTPGHYTVMQVESIIPRHYDQFPQYVEQMKELHAKAKRDNTWIRLLNSQDTHGNTGDPALETLRAKIASQYDPHLWVVGQDDVDNMAYPHHDPRSSTDSITLSTGEDPSRIAANAFLDEQTRQLDDIRSIVSDDCLLPFGPSNHFDWVLQDLQDNPQYQSMFVPKFIEELNKRGVMWVGSDARDELPVTDTVIWTHGNVSRSSYHGATANAYLRQFQGQRSVIAGHSHRMEYVESKPDPDTGKTTFVAICGTLGNIRPEYMNGRYIGHIWGFNCIAVPPSGRGGVAENVKIWMEDGYYQCYWRGQLYKERVTRDWNWINPFREEK